MRTNYVLIDYENVQPKDLALLNAEPFKVKLFIGTNQTKLPTPTVTVIQRLGDKAEYIQISGHGSNALDFHIAFYIGQLAAQDPTAFFHIISKDTGFDPLIEHLKSLKISVVRSSQIKDIPLLKIITLKSQIKTVTEWLQGLGPCKPGNTKALFGSINVLFKKQLTETELNTLVDEMKFQGLICIEQSKVQYTLPSSPTPHREIVTSVPTSTCR